MSSIIKFVGGLHTGGREWDLEAFGNLFSRLVSEVRYTGEIRRCIRYDGFNEDQCNVRFFGVEVNTIEDIPDGMIGLELQSDCWTVTDSKAGQNWEGKLTWNWLDGSTGEFEAECPPDWACQSFRMAANAYMAPDRACDDDIYLTDYDPTWPQQYKEMETLLRTQLGPDVALRIEHYGSTSIPNIPAKPIIDVLVEIPSFEEARKRAIPLFNKPESEYWTYSDHMIFILRDGLMGRRTHHVHMAPADHRLWEGLAFRDYLREHPEEASRYAALKYQLADQHKSDREAYINAKTEFVQEITAKALQGRHRP